MTEAEKMQIIMKHLRKAHEPKTLPSGSIKAQPSEEVLKQWAAVHLRNFDKPNSIYQNGNYHK